MPQSGTHCETVGRVRFERRLRSLTQGLGQTNAPLLCQRVFILGSVYLKPNLHYFFYHYYTEKMRVIYILVGYTDYI